jgi:hypothetical protein
METKKLWKIVVDAQLEMEAIERAVADVPGLTEPTSPVRGVELQRIDVVEGRSIVFVTGSDESAQALERSLKVAATGASVRFEEATAKELYANEPPKG